MYISKFDHDGLYVLGSKLKKRIQVCTLCTVEVFVVNHSSFVTPWFCHTNSGKLFCNCPLFVIALISGLFFGRKPDETCCHSVVASKWLKTKSVCSAGRNIKSLAVQRLKKLEEQCIHHFNLIKYLVSMTMSVL